jgi:hypothetical protein
MLDIAGGITNIDLIEENQLPYSGVGNMRYMTPRTIADQNKILGQTFTEQKPSGIENLLKFTYLESVLEIFSRFYQKILLK